MTPLEERIQTAKLLYGSTIEDILSKEQQHGMYEVLGAVEVLVSAKIHQSLPTTASERMIVAFVWLAREVSNGGFHQYFFNSAGDFWQDVLEGLSLIGDQNGVRLFQQVLSVFPAANPPAHRPARVEQLEKLEEDDEEGMSEHFDAATHQYHKSPYPNWQLVLDYVKAHPGEFDLRQA